MRTLHAEARDTAEAAIRRLAAGMLRGHARHLRGELPSRRARRCVNDDRVMDPTIDAVRDQFGDVVSENEPAWAPRISP